MRDRHREDRKELVSEVVTGNELLHLYLLGWLLSTKKIIKVN